VSLELQQAPQKYIPSRVFVGDDGDLKILVQNTSGIGVRGIRVQLTELNNALVAGRTVELRGPDLLAAGARAVISTGLGPFQDAGAASRFRSQVIAATPAP